MFYVKEMMGDAVEVNIEINDENVFCRCPHCGSEVQVDLQEILSDSDSDLLEQCCEVWKEGAGTGWLCITGRVQ